MTFHADPRVIPSATQSASRPIAAALAFALTALFWVPTLTTPQEARAAEVSDVRVQPGSTQVIVAYAPAPVLM